jgi:hypothetical protein
MLVSSSSDNHVPETRIGLRQRLFCALGALIAAGFALTAALTCFWLIRTGLAAVVASSVAGTVAYFSAATLGALAGLLGEAGIYRSLHFMMAGHRQELQALHKFGRENFLWN